MNELDVSFSLASPQDKDIPIDISVSDIEEDMIYRFCVGINGVWYTIQDFSTKKEVTWVPEEYGNYIVMVQAKKISSKKAFDYITRINYTIGKNFEDEKIIKSISLDKECYTVGDKLCLTVDSIYSPSLYKFWINGQYGWELLKDYTSDEKLVLTLNEIGEKEILVQCKKQDSENNFDDFSTVKFYVYEAVKIEITSLKSLSKGLISGEELIFECEVNNEESKTVLYKFLVIDEKGNVNVVQDYSTKSIVSFIENNSGSFKLLVLVKDLYSINNYDDRAVIIYEVKPYNEIKIIDFSADLSSPHYTGHPVIFNVQVEGGKNLMFKYTINGPSVDDEPFIEESGYLRENFYQWIPKVSGNYTAVVYVKDESKPQGYDVYSEMSFEVLPYVSQVVKILDVQIDSYEKHVKNKPIGIIVKAEGGLKLQYSFVITKENKEIGVIDYSDKNFLTFMPQESGYYELEIKVRDTFSVQEFDASTILHFKVWDYYPAKIDYILYKSQECYVVGEPIVFNIVAQNTKNILVKYVLSVDDQVIEETSFENNIVFQYVPTVKGKYTLSVMARNKDSECEYDTKKEAKIYVQDSLPVMDTKIICEAKEEDLVVNNSIFFVVSTKGGRDIGYEFYLMEQGQWRRVQTYSRKNTYSFIPFKAGDYKLLVLTKSEYKVCSYEDYGIYEFKVT